MQSRILGILVLAGAVIALSFLAPGIGGKLDGNMDLRGFDLKAERERLRAQIDRLGSEAAYRAFVTRFAGEEGADAHARAHVMGELLYEKEGIAGIRICDASFGFGCHHSLAGLAIAHEGEGSIRLLDAACVEAYGPQGLGCSHGIGHGVMAYYGEGGLGDALMRCTELSWQGTYGGCSDGVFMEYNFRLMEETQPLRTFSESGRFEPCADTTLYRESCFYNLPDWWYAALGSGEQAERTIGSYCDEVTEQRPRQACFRGVGHAIMIRTQLQIERGIRTCDALSASDGRLWCREGVAWSLFADPARGADAHIPCEEGLTAKESAACMAGYRFGVS